MSEPGLNGVPAKAIALGYAQFGCRFAPPCPGPLSGVPSPARTAAAAGPCAREPDASGQGVVYVLMLCYGGAVLVCWPGSVKSLELEQTLQHPPTQLWRWINKIALPKEHQTEGRTSSTSFSSSESFIPFLRSSFPLMLCFSGGRMLAQLLCVVLPFCGGFSSQAVSFCLLPAAA